MSGKSELEKNKRLYNALGLKDAAPVEDIKKAYRELALLHHPDKNPDDPDAAERFKEVNTAYQVLSNADRKKAYDASLSQPLSGYTRQASGRRFTETTASNLQEELNKFREARRAASSSFTREPSTPRPSQYTKEQQEMFKQREKERETEMRKRLEKEKEARREAEGERARRLQAEKDREEERRRVRREKLQRETMERVFDDKPRRAPSAGGVPQGRASSSTGFPPAGRTPPPPQTASEASGTFYQSSPIGAAKSGEFDRSADEALQAQRAAVERQKRERERQEEVRRKEQERFMEKKLLEVRQKEEAKQRQRDLEEAARFAQKFANLLLEEAQERNNSLIPEEAHERSMMRSSLVKIIALYNFNVAVRQLSANELDERHYISCDEVLGRSLMRCEGSESGTRAVIYRERRHELERTAVVMDREMNIIKSNFAQRLVLEKQERSERNTFSVQLRCFYELVDMEFVEAKVRVFLMAQYHKGVESIQADLFNALRRSVVDDELAVVRKEVESSERWARRFLSLERRESQERVQLFDGQVYMYHAILRQRANGLVAIQQATETTLELRIQELLKQRADDREEKNKLVLEISHLNNKLDASKGENEVLHSAHKLAMEQVEIAQRHSKPTPLVHEIGNDPVHELFPRSSEAGVMVDTTPSKTERGANPKTPDPQQSSYSTSSRRNSSVVGAVMIRTPPQTIEDSPAQTVGGVSNREGGGASQVEQEEDLSAGPTDRELELLDQLDERESEMVQMKHRIIQLEKALQEESERRRHFEQQATTTQQPLTSSVGAGPSARSSIVSSSPAAEPSTPNSVASTTSASFGGGGSSGQPTESKELVSLLCAENRRLLETNAKITEELKMLKKQQANNSINRQQQQQSVASPSDFGSSPLSTVKSPNRSKLWNNSSAMDTPPRTPPAQSHTPPAQNKSSAVMMSYASSSSYFSPSSSSPPDLKQRAAAAIGGATAQSEAARRYTNPGATSSGATTTTHGYEAASTRPNAVVWS